MQTPLKTALFGIVGWNIVETTQMIEIAKWFQDEFECHFFSHGGKFEHLVEEAGFVLHRLEPREDDAKIRLLRIIDRGELYQEPFTVSEIETRTNRQIQLIRKIHPQFAFLGSVLGFSFSCKLEHVKLFSLIQFALTKPYLEAKLPVSPYYPKGVNRLVRWMLLHLPLLMTSFRKVAKQYGLPKPLTRLDLSCGDVNIITEAKELSSLSDLPKNNYFSGPMLPNLNRAIPPEIQTALSVAKQPRIYLETDCLANHDLLMKTIQVMGDLDVIVVAPVASLLEKGDRIPKNVIVTSWLSAAKVLPWVDFAVTHGGQGHVQTNAFYGVPFVGIGVDPDQEVNIHLYKQFGCALQIRRKNFDPLKLKRAVLELLDNPKYKERALAAKAILQAVDVKTIVRDIVFSNL